MGRLAVMAENGFSKAQYSTRTLAASSASGSEELTDHESWRISTGRRSSYTNYFTSTPGTGVNTEIKVTLTCDRIRGFNGFCLDRGHNLAGKEVILECSNDNFATPAETAFDVVLPSIAMPSALDDTYGARTEEGAWVKRFSLRAGRYWRIRIPAMGAGLRPQIIGADLGNWIETDWIRPASRDGHDLIRQTVESNYGWQGFTKGARRRSYPLTMQMENAYAYDPFRTQVDGFFGDGAPMWVVHNTDEANRAALMIRSGPINWELNEQTGYEACVVPVQEHEPKLVGS